MRKLGLFFKLATKTQIGFVLHKHVFVSGFELSASDFRPEAGIGFVFSVEPRMNADKRRFLLFFETVP